MLAGSKAHCCVRCSGCKDNAGPPHCNPPCSLVRGECVSFRHQSSRAAASWSQEQIWRFRRTDNVDDRPAGSYCRLYPFVITMLSQLSPAFFYSNWSVKKEKKVSVLECVMYPHMQVTLSAFLDHLCNNGSVNKVHVHLSYPVAA